MTRINCIPQSELIRQHLLAEYRELPRLRHAKVCDNIPSSYRLGKGHCKFFYNKGRYLERRHAGLIEEMLRRGYTVNLPALKLDWEASRMQDWEPTQKAQTINRERINARITGKE